MQNIVLINNSRSALPASSGVAKTLGAHGRRTLRGPSVFMINLIPLIPPPHTPLRRISIYMILNTALFNQYISHGVFWKFGSLWWLDGGNGGPWRCNNKLDPLITWWEIRSHNRGSLIDDAMMNWDPLITWWEIKGHHFDDMMRKLGPLMAQWKI